MHKYMISGTSARAKGTEMDVQRLVVAGKEIKWCEALGTLWFCKTDIIRYFKKTEPKIEWMLGKLPGYLTAKLKVGTQALWFLELDGLELLFQLTHTKDDDPFRMAVKEVLGTDSTVDDIMDEQKEENGVNEIINIQGVQCYEKDGVAYLSLEAVARGLGFTKRADSGNEVVNWTRV